MVKQLLLVGLGGGCGSIFRYLISAYITKHYYGAFPFATFLINITGCILIGLFFGIAERTLILNSDLRLLLIVGFCGGYTTFSTFSAENLSLIQTGNYTVLILYTLLSTCLGLLGVYLGFQIAKM